MFDDAKLRSLIDKLGAYHSKPPTAPVPAQPMNRQERANTPQFNFPLAPPLIQKSEKPMKLPTSARRAKEQRRQSDARQHE